jgi:hypothetical protein
MIGMISTAPSAELSYGVAAAAAAKIELPAVAPIIGVKQLEVSKKKTWCSFLRKLISRKKGKDYSLKHTSGRPK